jgi:hypothetical protein
MNLDYLARHHREFRYAQNLWNQAYQFIIQEFTEQRWPHGKISIDLSPEQIDIHAVIEFAKVLFHDPAIRLHINTLRNNP